ncbi:MAG: hypothetical protein KAQ63_01860 [Candidatus Moranbacteria bacterium]|nr:hypothetical protein [Candidatus Moranbacteria bacterium]
MTKKKGINQILEKIKKEEIKPTPKWQCRLINGAFWLAVVAAVILSSIFLSVILINLFEIPLETFRYLQAGRYARIAFELFPFVGLFLVVISLILGLLAFHKTKYGYRYNFILLTSVLLAVVLLVGFGLHGFKISKPLREFTESQIPYDLRGGIFNKAQRSVLIEEGLLGGEIIRETKNKLFIKNLLSDKWEVSYDNETKIRNCTELKIGDQVVIVGESQGRFSFKAFVIKKVEGCLGCGTPSVKGAQNKFLDKPHYQQR